MATREWAVLVCSILSTLPWEPAPPLLLLVARSASRMLTDQRHDLFGCGGGADLMAPVVWGGGGG